MRIMSKIIRILVARVYPRQIAFEFPIEVLAERRRNLPALPAGYEVRQPPDPGDEATIAALLQQESGFGDWTIARVRHEILGSLAHPLAATLILHNGTPAACGFATDASTRRKQIARGMYLYVAPAYRARTQVATYITYSTLGHCVDAGYQEVVAFTDPERLSALLLYLSTGARPLHDTISSLWQWRRIQRRLAPALRRVARSRASRPNPRPLGPS